MWRIRPLLGYIATIAAYQAALQGQAALAVAEGQKALDLLSPQDDRVRCVVAYILAGLHFGSGEFARAHEACAVATRSARAAGNIHVAVPAAAALAETCLAQGRLREAAEHYQEALAWLDSRSRLEWPVRGRLLLGLGDIRRECNDLDEAERLMTEGITGMERWGNPEALLYGYAALVLLFLARQELGRAAGYVERALSFSQNRAVSPMARLELTAAHVQLLLDRGSASEAEALLQQGARAGEATPYLKERAEIPRARLEIALGRPEEAVRRLGPLAAEAERAGRAGHLLQMQVLTAAALEAQGDRAGAVRVLARSLKTAQPEGYVRLIVDEGARIAAPLAEIYREWRVLEMGTCVPYIQKLLAALRTPGPLGEAPPGTAGPVARGFVEPPSGRELDVLRLIAAGSTNQEIAAQLFIAESTVKRHISNLYGKLGVTHRTEVLIRARELGLL
jgi:LuxR family maltose regulon positive regulatory protein